MVLAHETAVRDLDLLVARLGAHAEHAIRGVHALLHAAARKPAHDRLELIELRPAHAERARDARQSLALLAADDARAERGLQLELHESARQAAATVELGEPLLERVAGALAAREM